MVLPQISNQLSCVCGCSELLRVVRSCKFSFLFNPVALSVLFISNRNTNLPFHRYVVLVEVNRGLSEARTTVPLNYEILYIFTLLLSKIADLLLITVILKTLQARLFDSNPITKSSRSRSASLGITVAVSFLALLTITSWALYTAVIAKDLEARVTYSVAQKLSLAYEYITLAYYAIYMIVAFFVFSFSILLFARERSKVRLIPFQLLPFVVSSTRHPRPN